jgi:hypothetical protein
VNMLTIETSQSLRAQERMHNTSKYIGRNKPTRFALFRDLPYQNVRIKGEVNGQERWMGMCLCDVIYWLSRTVCVVESVKLRACHVAHELF